MRPPRSGRSSFGEFLDANFWEIFAFVISFAVIARFWVVHHRIFESVRDYNQWIVWFNFLWLLAIVAIPFTANVLSVSRGERPGGLRALHRRHAAGHGRHAADRRCPVPVPRADDGRGAREHIDKTRGLAEVIIMALALVLAVVVPAINLWWLFLLFLAGPLHALLRRLAYGSSQTAG